MKCPDENNLDVWIEIKLKSFGDKSNSLPVVPHLFFHLALLGCVGCLPMPFAAPKLTFSCCPASSMKHCWTIFHTLFIDKLLLVTSLPCVHRLAMFHPICVVALLCVPATPNLCRTMDDSVLVFKLNSLPGRCKQSSWTSQLVLLICALLLATVRVDHSRLSVQFPVDIVPLLYFP